MINEKRLGIIFFDSFARVKWGDCVIKFGKDGFFSIRETNLVRQEENNHLYDRFMGPKKLSEAVGFDIAANLREL